MIFNMQMGFTLLEAGIVRSKNVKNILTKNLVDFFIGALVYWAIGFGFATNLNGGLMGNGVMFKTQLDDTQTIDWLIGFCFCSTACTIVSGSLAERTFIDTYIFFNVLMAAVTYPVAAGWVWGGGWLGNLGFHDFAGSGVVHLLGGVTGLIGTYILGPRHGYFGK